MDQERSLVGHLTKLEPILKFTTARCVGVGGFIPDRSIKFSGPDQLKLFLVVAE